MEFEHFIITPFNLRNYPKVVYEHERWLVWTKKRVEMFKQYCFRSMIQQSIRNFTWLLYLDSETPDAVRNELPDVTLYPHIHYVYVDGFQQFIDQYMRDVRRMCSKDTRWVMTSRFDNDDCMHQEAVEFFQRYFQPKDEFMVSLVSGFVYNLKTRCLSHYYYPNSPFISLIENLNKPELKGIFHLLNHCAWPALKFGLLKKSKEAAFVLSPVLWMQIYHEGNVSNSFYRGVPVMKSLDLSSFGIQEKSHPASWSSLFHYRMYHFWKVYVKVVLCRIFKKTDDEEVI